MLSSNWMLGSLRSRFFLAVVSVLGLQAAASRMVNIQERELPNPGLHELPMTLGVWHAASEGALEQAVSEYLRPDEYIIRDYVDQKSGEGINFFVAYFKSLQNNYGPHSPSVCLPGNGWLERASSIQSVEVPGRGQPIRVNEYVMERSNQRILVLYWYQNNRDVWAEEFRAKLRLLPDLIRYKRSDVSLVRLIIPLHGSLSATERTNSLQFTRLVFPALVQRFAAGD